MTGPGGVSGHPPRRGDQSPEAAARLAGALAAADPGAGGDRLLAEGLLAMTGALVVSVSRFDPQTGHLRSGHLAAPAEVLAAARRLLGQSPESLDLRPGASLKMLLEGPDAVEFADLREVFFGQVPEEIVSEMELALDLGRVYGLALRHGRELLGTAVIFMPRGGGSLPVADLAEWARLISAALPHRHPEEKRSSRP